MTYTPGRFVWHELMTDDIEKAKTFYNGLVGWTTETMKMPDGSDYHMIKLGGDHMIGGYFDKNKLGPDMAKGVPNSWTAYVSVPNIDEGVAAVSSNGGTVVVPKTEIGMGTFAGVTDPQGAFFYLWKSAEADPEPGPPKAGTFCWDQLNTTDTAAAKTFYAKVTGWVPGEFAGSEIFKTNENDEMGVASLMEAQPGVPPHWLAHIMLTTSLDDGRKKTESLGGTVVVPEIPVPSVGKFAIITDNTGATVSIFEPEK